MPDTSACPIEINPMKQPKLQTRWWIFVIMALAGLNLGQQTIAQPLNLTDAVLLSQRTTNALAENISADKLFRDAYENRYTWNSQFPGYTAAINLKQGKEVHRGSVRVNPDLSVEVTGINNTDVRETVEYRLQMINTHRQRVPFEVAHKNSTFTFGTKDKTGVVEIIEQGETKASYRLLNQQVVQVNRSIGPHSFTVDTLDTQVTPEGYIGTHYRATAIQPQTKQVLGEEVSKDTYKNIGGYYLPTRQVLQRSEGAEQYQVEFSLTDVQLLSSN